MLSVRISRHFLVLADVNYLVAHMNTINAVSGIMNSLTSMPFLFTVAALLTSLGCVRANPAIAVGYDPLEICIENCALCKKMLGAWFEGPLCADSCIKFKGKMIPECEDITSIARFLNKLT